MVDDTKFHSTQHDVQKKRLKSKLPTGHPKGTEKQLDYILVDRKHMYCSRDAEANDMIHMGCDHRSVMAQFVITAPKKEVSQKTHIAKKKIKQQRAQRAKMMKKTRSDEANKFEERYAELERKKQA